GSFGVVYNLVSYTIKARHKDEVTPPRSERPLITAGLLGGLLVTLMGNLEGVLEALHARGLLPASFWNWIDVPGLAQSDVLNSWNPDRIFMWWWHASRVLADKNFAGKDMVFQPIDEFPFFSFLLGDNHPHVLALPFVLLAIALAFNLLLRQMSKVRLPAEVGADASSDPHQRWWNPVAFALDNDWVLFVFSALILGALGFLNTWDLPIYLGLVVLAYGLGEALVKTRLDRQIVFRSAILGLGLGILSILLYIYFYLSFSSQASGILPYVFPPTRLPQYLVMFGTFVFLLTYFLFVYLGKESQGSRLWLKSAFSWWWRILLICIGLYLAIMVLIALALFVVQPIPESTLAATIQSVLGGLTLKEAFTASLAAHLRDPWLMLMLSALLALVIAGVSSVFQKNRTSDEAQSETAGGQPTLITDSFVFLLIFIGLALTLLVEFLYLRDGFGVRMNTLFKFYYQAWVMMGCASAYGVWWLFDRLKRPGSRVIFGLAATLFISLGLVYTVFAIPSRANNFVGPANLDG
ncbi:MAG TPA: DUF2298 domain-containing protein, partial [Anaerolineales bacterium]